MNRRRTAALMREDLTPRWLDLVAVQRAVRGQPVGRALHRAERVEVARRLPDATANHLAEVIGCSVRDAHTYIQEATCSA